MKKKLMLMLSILFIISLFSGCGDDTPKKDSIQQSSSNEQINTISNKTITVQYNSGDFIIKTKDLNDCSVNYYFGGMIGKDTFSIATNFNSTYNNAIACNFYFPLIKGYRFKLPSSKFQLVVTNFDIEKGTIELSEGQN